MKRHALHGLVLFSAALVLVLLWQWFTPAGALRNVHWQRPTAQKTDFATMLPALPGIAPADTSQFLAMLDRPLFSLTRRPPPPATPPSAPEQAPEDNLSSAKLSGVYQGVGAGGIILKIAGKDRRVQLNEAVDGWTVQDISERNVTFSRGGQIRVLALPRAALTGPAGIGGAPPPAAAILQAPQGPQAAQASPQAPPRAVFGGSSR